MDFCWDAVCAFPCQARERGGTWRGLRITSGVFTIQDTIGQPDADPLAPSSGGPCRTSGGFWPGIAPAARPLSTKRPDSSAQPICG